MKTIVKKQYEAMFLVDTAIASSDWDGVIKTIEKILKKTGAEMVSINKWDERPLAYDIRGKSRGTYILCYFNSEGPKVAQIEREVQLTEDIMRVLILNAEQMSPEDIDKESPFAKAQRRAEETEQKAKELEEQKAKEQAEQKEQEEAVAAEEVVEEQQEQQQEPGETSEETESEKVD